ncbi:unnamed protein product [Vitrella brassicaformis CCMP3155]|uniref:Signal peptide peptidase n=2 Tax=Vitrella brassicaformis TaxID=1169539 RepID=A0A0G4EKB6_VITBC|nr:unnamed protein product [Vitrella brassicaformis CCMP3155]|eukprot:CEL97129.1 unnamed protein product [Vitrella brassicaformis CCMP3155]
MVPTNGQLFMLANGILGGLVVLTNFVLLPIILQMILYAATIIYIGSHLSLKLKETDPVTGEKQMGESMSQKDAMMFPIIGSVSLVTLYVFYKFLSPYWVNLLLTTYLSILGIAALAATISPVLERVVPIPAKVLDRKFHITFQLPGPLKRKEGPHDFRFTVLDIVSHVVSLLVAIAWLVTKHWCLHNIFAIAFSIQMISLVSLGRFQVAFILLSGLFIYDIFWVFGTDVMVTVAKSFEGPAKLVFPVSFDPWKQSILGLGDIVIPGIFIAMCLRFDQHLFEEGLEGAPVKKKDDVIDIHQGFHKVYFTSAMVAYCLGLATTGAVMFVFQHAQPALLYLVPFCLGALLLTAVIRREWSHVWTYKEEEDNKDDKKEATDADTAAEGTQDDNDESSMESKKSQ